MKQMVLVLDTLESFISALHVRIPYHVRVSPIMWRRVNMKGMSVSIKEEGNAREDQPTSRRYIRQDRIG